MGKEDFIIELKNVRIETLMPNRVKDTFYEAGISPLNLVKVINLPINVIQDF